MTQSMPGLRNSHGAGVGEVGRRFRGGVYLYGRLEGLADDRRELRLIQPPDWAQTGLAEGVRKRGHVGAQHLGRAPDAAPGCLDRPGSGAEIKRQADRRAVREGVQPRLVQERPVLE